MFSLHWAPQTMELVLGLGPSMGPWGLPRVTAAPSPAIQGPFQFSVLTPFQAPSHSSVSAGDSATHLPASALCVPRAW